MNERENRILLVTCYGHFMSHVNMLVFPAVVLPLTERLGLDMVQVLGLSFWMYLLFGLTALPWGVLADRFGARPFMLLFFLGTGVGSLAAAFCMDSPGLLTLCLACMGAFAGIYHPVGLGMISTGVRDVSMAMGYNGMFGSLGLAAGPLLAGLATWLWGCDSAYIVLGMANLLGFGLMLFVQGGDLDPGGVSTASGKEGDLSAFLILLVAMMLAGIAYRGATVILPAYVELRGQGLVRLVSDLSGRSFSGNLMASCVATFVFLVAVVGQYTGGRVARRFDPRLAYLLFHAITVPAAFLMAQVLDLSLVCVTTVYFFFLLGMQPIENTLVARFAARRLHHAAYGTKFVLAFGVGALGVKLVGRIEQGAGIVAVFPALGLLSLSLVVVAVLLVFRTKPD